MLDRRAFLLLSGSTGLLLACGGGPPGPATVNATVTGALGMNPGPDGTDRPVTVTLLRLRDAGAFTSADVLALQDPATVLAADLVGMDQVAVAPGGTVAKTLVMEPEATQLGVMAAFRDPTGKVWRQAVPVTAGSTVTANISVGPGGLAVQVS
jgi:type VI secretion system protein VasD